MTTGLLNIAEKIDLARFQTSLPTIGAAAADREILSSWLDAHVRHQRVRDLLRMIVRVTTFTNDPERQSAGAALAQLRLGLKGVLYLDGGWQTIVEGLRRAALAAGARIVTAAPAVGLERHHVREATAVRLADDGHARVRGRHRRGTRRSRRAHRRDDVRVDAAVARADRHARRRLAIAAEAEADARVRRRHAAVFFGPLGRRAPGAAAGGRRRRCSRRRRPRCWRSCSASRRATSRASKRCLPRT